VWLEAAIFSRNLVVVLEVIEKYIGSNGATLEKCFRHLIAF
jgi:hypothetical protein